MMAALTPTTTSGGPKITYSSQIYPAMTSLFPLSRSLTPSQDEEEPPLLAELTEHDHQHEVEQDALTEHPAEHCCKQVVEESSHKCTTNLQRQLKRSHFMFDVKFNISIDTYYNKRMPMPINSINKVLTVALLVLGMD